MTVGLVVAAIFGGVSYTVVKAVLSKGGSQSKIPAKDWQSFSPKDTNYEVKMPGTPTENNDNLNGLQGRKFVLLRMADQVSFTVTRPLSQSKTSGA